MVFKLQQNGELFSVLKSLPNEILQMILKLHEMLFVYLFKSFRIICLFYVSAFQITKVCMNKCSLMKSRGFWTFF